MIRGVNDREQDVKNLVKLLAGVNFKLNLIPLNPIGPSRLESPSPEDLTRFRDLLYDHEVRVMVRFSKGQDIGAACGQLVRNAGAEVDGTSHSTTEIR